MIEPTPLGLTPVQATEAVKAIRDFIIRLDDSGEREREFLSSLSAMEDASGAPNEDIVQNHLT